LSGEGQLGPVGRRLHVAPSACEQRREFDANPDLIHPHPARWPAQPDVVHSEFQWRAWQRTVVERPPGLGATGYRWRAEFSQGYGGNGCALQPAIQPAAGCEYVDGYQRHGLWHRRIWL